MQKTAALIRLKSRSEEFHTSVKSEKGVIREWPVP